MIPDYIRCSYSDIIPIKELQAHPKNPNVHPKEQVQRLAEIIKYQGIRRPVRVSTLSGFITAGHGLVEACALNGWTEIPIDAQPYDSEDQEYADMVADNALAAWAHMPLEKINYEIQNLGPDFNLDHLGLNEFVLDPSEKFSSEDCDPISQLYSLCTKCGQKIKDEES
jgi:ParB-like chromosome segregation protein Spo0J